MRIKRRPAGFVVPAQPVKASTPPSGADWVHEIKHDGYRMIVRRDGPSVRLYSRNAYDWTARLAAIAAAAELADDEGVQSIIGRDPVVTGQLARDELAKGEADPNYRLRLAEPNIVLSAKEG